MSAACEVLRPALANTVTFSEQTNLWKRRSFFSFCKIVHLSYFCIWNQNEGSVFVLNLSHFTFKLDFKRLKFDNKPFVRPCGASHSNKATARVLEDV